MNLTILGILYYWSQTVFVHKNELLNTVSYAEDLLEDNWINSTETYLPPQSKQMPSFYHYLCLPLA